MGLKKEEFKGPPHISNKARINLVIKPNKEFIRKCKDGLLLFININAKPNSISKFEVEDPVMSE